MSADISDMLARLKLLPPRLRIAHLSALLRYERERDAVVFAHMNGFLSLPPRAKRVAGRVDASRRQASGWGEFLQTATPHPGLRFAPAFPPHRFAGGGIGERATKSDCPRFERVFSLRVSELTALLCALSVVTARGGRAG